MDAILKNTEINYTKDVVRFGMFMRALKNVSFFLLAASTLVACSLQSDNMTEIPRSNTNNNGGGGGGGNVSREYFATNLTHANNFVPTLAVAVGVGDYLTNTALMAAEANYRNALSMNGNPMAYNAQMSLAVMALTTSFCRQASSNELGRADAARIMYPGVAINVVMPAGGFSDATLRKMAENAWKRFRGESSIPDEVALELVNSAKQIYSMLPATATNNNTTASKANVLGSRAVAESICIIVGSSLGSLSNNI